MKTGIITVNAGMKENGESVILATSKEIGILLSAMEEYATKHKKSSLVKSIVAELEMLPCRQPQARVPKIKFPVKSNP